LSLSATLLEITNWTTNITQIFTNIPMLACKTQFSAI